MAPSPEVDLLETLASQDEKLIVVAGIFGGVENDDNFERVKRVLHIYADSGVVKIYRIAEKEKQLVPYWEVRFVLMDKTNWLNLDTSTVHWVSLTDKGREVFFKDSEGLFNNLFNR